MQLLRMMSVLLLLPLTAWAQGGPKPKAAADAPVAKKAMKAKMAGPGAKGKEKAMEAREAGLTKAAEHRSAKGEEHSKAEEAPGATPGEKPEGAEPEKAGHPHGRAAAMARKLIRARGNLTAARSAARSQRRERLRAQLKNPDIKVSVAALRQELRQNARRMARLARVRELAEAADDKETLERVDKLIQHELARHGRWMGKHKLEVEVPAEAAVPPPPAAPPGAAEKGGAE